MNKMKIFFLGLFAFCLIVPAASAQGLLGVQYLEVGGGYARLKGFGETFDGWEAGAALNSPLTAVEEFGVDFNLSGGYARVTGGGLKVDGYGVAGLFRGYVPVGAFSPYAEAGLSWARAKSRAPGFSETDSSFAVPLGVGVEILIGTFSLTPFYNYLIELDSDIDDSWAVGVKGAHWFNPGMGVTLTFTHMDMDEVDGFSVIGGLTFAF